MSESRKVSVWPWIVGGVVACCVALVIGAVCFFTVLWIGNERFRQYIIDHGQNVESRK
jgi:hypothetical protein